VLENITSLSAYWVGGARYYVIYKRENKNGSQKGKKPVKPVEFTEPSELQKYIQALEEYEQGTPIPATLLDFLTEEVIEAILGLDKEEEGSDDEEELQDENVYLLRHS
jgi:hypothetical protein